MQIFYIFLAESFVSSEKLHTFAAQKGVRPVVIGLWCNGNTADSGPAFPGSSPGSPTLKRASQMWRSFFVPYQLDICLYWRFYKENASIYVDSIDFHYICGRFMNSYVHANV